VVFSFVAEVLKTIRSLSCLDVEKTSISLAAVLSRSLSLVSGWAHGGTQDVDVSGLKAWRPTTCMILYEVLYTVD